MNDKLIGIKQDLIDQIYDNKKEVNTKISLLSNETTDRIVQAENTFTEADSI